MSKKPRNRLVGEQKQMEAPRMTYLGGSKYEIEDYGIVEVDSDRGYIWMAGRPIATWSQAEVERVIPIVDRAFPDAGLYDGQWFVCDGMYS